VQVMVVVKVRSICVELDSGLSTIKGFKKPKTLNKYIDKEIKKRIDNVTKQKEKF
jgi:hypothetical protein